MPAIFIETDGLQEISKDVKKVEVNSYESFVEAVKIVVLLALVAQAFQHMLNFQ